MGLMTSLGNSAVSLRTDLLLVLTIVLAWVVHLPVLPAQTLSPYADFQAMTEAQLTTLQVKLTYVGIQDRVVSSLAFTSTSGAVNVSVFGPFRQAGISYVNDDG